MVTLATMSPDKIQMAAVGGGVITVCVCVCVAGREHLPADGGSACCQPEPESFQRRLWSHKTPV